MIDELTGIGNAEYYNYAFEQLLSRQSKNLYAVVYLAYKVEKISIECGEKTIKEIANISNLVSPTGNKWIYNIATEKGMLFSF